MITDYVFKTKPFNHQLVTWKDTRDKKVFAIFWDQGTGKSKLIIDTAGWLYQNGEIDALVVIAPNGVQRNWVTDELPAHLPDIIASNMVSHFYETGRAKTQWHAKACKEVLQHKGFSVLAMSYSSLMTEIGRKTLKTFLTKRKCLYVLDESVAIKTPKAKRTKRVLASARYAEYRRILTGTPVTNGAFDVYAPIRFLDKDFWSNHGLGTYQIFKNYFGVFFDGFNNATRRAFRSLTAFKNLEELHDMLKVISTRVTKDEVLDLPPKLYSKRYVELTPEQERVYAELKEKYMVELEDGEVNAPLAMVRLLKFHQIICGFIKNDDGDVITIGKKNPRLDTLVEQCEGLTHKAIIWSGFTHNIDLITDALKGRCVRYDGVVTSGDKRADAIEQFQRGDAQFFVANQGAAGQGLTLHAARTVIYYSNTFKLVERLQSEDRAHRIGQEHPVNYIDLIVPDTVDERIVLALRSKRDVAGIITGDKLGEWL